MKLRHGMLCLTLGCLSLPSGLKAQDMMVDFARMAALRRAAIPESVAAIRRYIGAANFSPERKAAIETFLRSADIGLPAEARRDLAHARALIGDQPCTPEQQFASSLDAAPLPVFVDLDRPVAVRITRDFVAPVPNDALLRLQLQQRNGPAIMLGERRMTKLHGASGRMQFALPRTAPGRYGFVAEVVVGGKVLSRSVTQVDIVPNLGRAERVARARLAKVSASDDARALVLYPFELARLIESGTRELERRPLAVRLARSEQVLTQLERGTDPTVGGTGDQQLAYRLADAGEIMPYRIYVPTGWTPGKALAIVLALHGGGADENELLDLDGGKFGRLAERYGYIVVAPLGYRPVGGWGSPIRLPSVYGSTTTEGRDVGGAQRARMLALSEKDALTVFEKVAKAYGADRSRMFVTGHSMGGGGTWYMAERHRELWAGAAASAGPFFGDSYDFGKLRGMGLMIAQGEGDTPSLAADRRLAADLLTKGISVTYVESPSINHGQTYGASLPSIFEFFERQTLRASPGTALPLR